MDAVEYLKNKTRFMNELCQDGCIRCPFGIDSNGKDVECEDLEAKYPETAVKIIEKWSAEHPVKTRQSEFLKLFPNVDIRNGVLNICPREIDLNSIREEKCMNSFCPECKKEYWLVEVE